MPESSLIFALFAAGLFGLAVLLLSLAVWRLVQRHRAGGGGPGAQTSMRRAEMRQAAMENSSLFRLFIPFIGGISGSVHKLGLEPLRQYVHDPYARAGYPGGMDDEEVVATGLLISAGCTLVLAVLSGSLIGFFFVWICLIGIPAGFLLLVMQLRAIARDRERAILRALPYALDLLILMLRSGTSLRIALSRVVDDYQRQPLGAEFGQVMAEIDVGAPRAEAFRKMAERLKIADMTLLVDAIAQSEELGWPLADTLERLADRVNAERVLRAQATAGAAGVYVMLPSTMVLMAAILLLFAPFIVNYLVTGNIV